MSIDVKALTQFDTALIFPNIADLESFMQDNNVSIISPVTNSVVLSGQEYTYFSPWLHNTEEGLIWSPGTRDALELGLPILWDKKEDYFAWKDEFLSSTITRDENLLYVQTFAALDIFQYHNDFLFAPPYIFKEIQEQDGKPLILSPWTDPSDMLWAMKNSKPIGFFDTKSYTEWRELELETEHDDSPVLIDDNEFTGAHDFSTFSHMLMYLEANDIQVENRKYYDDLEKIPRGKKILYVEHEIDVGMFQFIKEKGIPVLWDSPEQMLAFDIAKIERLQKRPIVRDPELKPSFENAFTESTAREKYEEPNTMLQLLAAVFSDGPFNTIGPKFQGKTMRKSGNSGADEVRIDEKIHFEGTPVGNRGNVVYVSIEEDYQSQLRPRVFKEYSTNGRRSPKMIPVLNRFVESAREKELHIPEIIEAGADYIEFEKIDGLTLSEIVGAATQLYNLTINLEISEEQAVEYILRAIKEIGKINRETTSLIGEEDARYILALDYGITAKSLMKGLISKTTGIPISKLDKIPEDEFFFSLNPDMRKQIIDNYPGFRIARYLERSEQDGTLVLDEVFLRNYMDLVGETRESLFNGFARWSTDAKPDNLMIPIINPRSPNPMLSEEIINVDPQLELNFIHKDFHLLAGSLELLSLSSGNTNQHFALLENLRIEYMNAHNIPLSDMFPYVLAEWVSGFETQYMEAKNLLRDTTNNDKAEFMDVYKAVRESELRRSLGLSNFYAFVSHLYGFHADNPTKPDVVTMTSEFGQATFKSFDDVDYSRPGFLDFAKEKYSLSDEEVSVLEKTMYVAQQMERSHFVRVQRLLDTKINSGAITLEQEQVIFDQVYNHPEMFGSQIGDNPIKFFQQIIDGADGLYQTNLTRSK